MRRSSLAFVFIALALLSRLLTPLVAEARGFDPLSDAPICTHDGSSQDTGRPDGNPAHHSACDLICCHVAPPLADNTPVIHGVLMRATLVAWHRRTASIVIARALETHRARGPPSIS